MYRESRVMNRRIVQLILVALVLSASACSMFRQHPQSASATGAPDADVVERDLSQPYERAQ